MGAGIPVKWYPTGEPHWYNVGCVTPPDRSTHSGMGYIALSGCQGVVVTPSKPLSCNQPVASTDNEISQGTRTKKAKWNTFGYTGLTPVCSVKISRRTNVQPRPMNLRICQILARWKYFRLIPPMLKLNNLWNQLQIIISSTKLHCG